MSLSVVLPCKNETEAIPWVLPKLMETRKKALKIGLVDHFEIIVVDDHSTDDSWEKLNAFGAPVKVVRNTGTPGYGAALKFGISHSQTDWIAFFDLDDTHNPDNLLSMLETAKKKQLQLVTGVRLHKKSQMPYVRRMGNLFFAKLSSLFFQKNVTDVTSGMRLVHGLTLRQLNSQLPDGLNYSLALSLHFLREKIPFAEIAVDYAERKGFSKLHALSDGPIFLKTIVKSRMRASV